MFLKTIRGRSMYRIMSACCGSAFMLYGYDAGVLGGIQATAPFQEAIGVVNAGPFVIPIIASIYTLAAACSSLFVACFGMPIGRRKTILAGDVLIIIGASLQASSWSIGQIVAGRILCGFGIGCIASAVPTYMAEMSLEAKERGPEVSLQGALLITGVALAYWVDFGFVQVPNQIWRVPLGLQSCFAIFSALGLIFLPDTPRWYYARGRFDEGDDVLARLHDLPIEAEQVQKVRREILKSIEEESDAKFNVWSLFWDNSALQIGRRLRTSGLILFMQQLMGINMLVYFSTIIFTNIGYDKFLAGILAAVMNTVFAISCYPPIWIIEKVGRRPLMIWTAIGCGVCLIIFDIMINLTHQTLATGWVAAVFIIVYNIFFGIGWLGPPWVYGPEIAPLRYRHIAGALGAFGEWLSTFIVVFGGGTGINDAGPKIWIWPTICCFLTAAYVWWFCPETTGRTLEEIDYLFAKPEVKEQMEREGVLDGNTATVEKLGDGGSGEAGGLMPSGITRHLRSSSSDRNITAHAAGNDAGYDEKLINGGEKGHVENV